MGWCTLMKDTIRVTPACTDRTHSCNTWFFSASKSSSRVMITSQEKRLIGKDVSSSCLILSQGKLVRCCPGYRSHLESMSISNQERLEVVCGFRAVNSPCSLRTHSPLLRALTYQVSFTRNQYISRISYIKWGLISTWKVWLAVLAHGCSGQHRVYRKEKAGINIEWSKILPHVNQRKYQKSPWARCSDMRL